MQVVAFIVDHFCTNGQSILVEIPGGNRIGFGEGEGKEVNHGVVSEEGEGVLEYFFLSEVNDGECFFSEEGDDDFVVGGHAETYDAVGEGVSFDEGTLMVEMEDGSGLWEVEVGELAWCDLFAQHYKGGIVGNVDLSNSDEGGEGELC